MDLYCKDDHIWEGTPSDPDHPHVYGCTECIANARKENDQMVVIMCTHAGCTNPAWRSMEPENVWVCEEHYIGVILL